MGTTVRCFKEPERTLEVFVQPFYSAHKEKRHLLSIRLPVSGEGGSQTGGLSVSTCWPALSSALLASENTSGAHPGQQAVGTVPGPGPAVCVQSDSWSQQEQSECWLSGQIKWEQRPPWDSSAEGRVRPMGKPGAEAPLALLPIGPLVWMLTLFSVVSLGRAPARGSRG